MFDSAHQWDPSSGASWARMLGMVHVPMFASRAPTTLAEETAILLDGSRGSFAFIRTLDAAFADTIGPLSWSWSSCVRHLVAVLPDADRMYVRRWDDPQTSLRFEMPHQGMGAISLLAKLESATEPRRPNVVRHVLEPFRKIRARVGDDNPLLAMQLLNGLLLVVETMPSSSRAGDIEVIRTFGDAIELLSPKDLELCGLQDVPRRTAAMDARDLVRTMASPDPYTGCTLHPSLLFRHAASRLYQEAHLEIERSPQGYITGLEPTHEPPGAPFARDVRFTPPNLARALVQKAFETMPNRRRDLTILDPACGSGVFLVEALRELGNDASFCEHKIKLVGYDILPGAAFMEHLRLAGKLIPGLPGGIACSIYSAPISKRTISVHYSLLFRLRRAR